MKTLEHSVTVIFAFCLCTIINSNAQTSNLSLTAWQVEDLKNYQKQISLPPDISSFIASKEEQADEIAAKNGVVLGADLKKYFAAAKAGRAREAEQIRYGIFNDTNNPADQGPLHQAFVDAQLALEQFTLCDPGLVMMAGKDYMDSLPAGCIYFGGTDPGRGLPTALCRAPGDPIFVLTQNLLCTSDYIQYVRDLYGSRINLPTPDEVKMPAAGDWGVWQMNIMRSNALIARAIFDKNPDRDFYYEESFPLDWAFPYLTPHGVGMKLNRTPVDSISTNDVEQDTEFWSAKIKQLEGNPKFATDNTRKIYSHLRCSIAGVYAWRASPLNTKDAIERQRMMQAANTAFKQALELFPQSPEAVFRCVNMDMQLQKVQDALDIAKAAVQADPSNENFTNLVQQVEKMATPAKPAAPK